MESLHEFAVFHQFLFSQVLAQHLQHQSDEDDDQASDDQSNEETTDDESSDEEDNDQQTDDEEESKKRKRSALFTAVAKGNLEKVVKQIEDGADANAVIDGVPILHWAILNNHLNIVSALLKAGALPNALDKASQSVLQRAVTRKNFAIFKVLVEAKADVHYNGGKHNNKKESILHKAIDAGHEDMAKLLLEHGANVNATDSQGKSVLFYAAIRMKERSKISDEEYEAPLRLLISHGAKLLRDGPGGENKSFETVLRYGSLRAVQLFLNKGINLKDIRDQSLLHIALKNLKSADDKAQGSPEVLKYLLDTDLFDIEKEDAEGCSVLSQAIGDARFANGDSAPVELLLRYGANSNSRGRNNRIPLVAAVDNVHVTAMKLLLEYGADLDDKICKKILSSIRFWKHRPLTESRRNDFSRKTYEILIRHIALRESQNWKETPDHFEITELHPKGDDYYRACKDELELLKNVVVYKSLTLYNVLTGKNIYRHVDNKHVVKAYKDLDVAKKFPKYGSQIGRRLFRLREKHRLMLQAMGGLSRVLKYDVNALHLIAYNVLGRLEKSDLRNLSKV